MEITKTKIPATHKNDTVYEVGGEYFKLRRPAIGDEHFKRGVLTFFVTAAACDKFGKATPQAASKNKVAGEGYIKNPDDYEIDEKHQISVILGNGDDVEGQLVAALELRLLARKKEYSDKKLLLGK